MASSSDGGGGSSAALGDGALGAPLATRRPTSRARGVLLGELGGARAAAPAGAAAAAAAAVATVAADGSSQVGGVELFGGDASDSELEEAAAAAAADVAAADDDDDDRDDDAALPAGRTWRSRISPIGDVTTPSGCSDCSIVTSRKWRRRPHAACSARAAVFSRISSCRRASRAALACALTPRPSAGSAKHDARYCTVLLRISRCIGAPPSCDGRHPPLDGRDPKGRCTPEL